MAGTLNAHQVMLAAALLLGLPAVSCLAAQASAESADPTRPPAAASPLPAVVSGAAASSGFQAIIRRPGKKPVALIKGEMVELGGKLNEATLIELSDTQAVLQGPGGKEVLRLTPAAGKLATKPKGKEMSKRTHSQVEHD